MHLKLNVYALWRFNGKSKYPCVFFQVRQVIWSQEDSKIISCGMDGAVYEWNVTSYKREGESVLKSCSYTSVSVSPDSRTTFAVGSDRTLKEICDSQVIK